MGAELVKGPGWMVVSVRRTGRDTENLQGRNTPNVFQELLREANLHCFFFSPKSWMPVCCLQVTKSRGAVEELPGLGSYLTGAPAKEYYVPTFPVHAVVGPPYRTLGYPGATGSAHLAHYQ